MKDLKLSHSSIESHSDQAAQLQCMASELTINRYEDSDGEDFGGEGEGSEDDEEDEEDVEEEAVPGKSPAFLTLRRTRHLPSHMACLVDLI